jgi:alpha-L-rhamnosidase
MIVNRKLTLAAAAGWCLLGGALSAGAVPACPRVAALDAALWEKSEWISAADAPVYSRAKNGPRAAPGTSWFVGGFVNEGTVVSAKWMTTGLGVYELFVNGTRVGEDVLKPGFTHVRKTRRSFTYDVTALLRKAAGERNVLSAEVSAGWWRDKIVNFTGKKSALRAVLEVTYAGGVVKIYGTRAAEWRAGVGGPVKEAAIFDGEEYDARVPAPFAGNAAFAPAERNTEFTGEILPSQGAEICLRVDKTLRAASAYIWKGVDGADRAKKLHGRVHRLRDVTFDGKTPTTLAKGETLVVDFGQNCAGVPKFVFTAAPGTVLTCLPAEMLNDANGEYARGNDGPAGSVYRRSLRIPNDGMRLVYTFGAPAGADGFATYLPRHTFFGYRYISVTATADVTLREIVSIPVTSITKEMESGSLETGVPEVNRLIANVYWGQLSNYLSVPTDCPQRNERLGWTADTQVFTEAGAFVADTRGFFRKWMRDLTDSQDRRGGFPGVAPAAQYGNNSMRFCWADAGVIVPYQIWKQFGETSIITENWSAMEKFVARVDETRYEYTATRQENGGYQWADWLSYEDLESSSGKMRANGRMRPEAIVYWNYLGACYWCWDARMMAEMARAVGKDAAKYERMAAAAAAHIRSTFFDRDGYLLAPMRGMQTPVLFALKLGLVPAAVRAQTIAALRRNFAEHGDCLQTGFLGTSILMETLTEIGLSDLAYTLLLQRKDPSWLYSVDQGATTIWERWNSYTKERGFGPVGMNSFNHYAYGAVLAWMYKVMAGISADPAAPGFRNILMAPRPDRRIGWVKARYRSAAGLVESAWRYEGDEWVWTFTIPAGATATVTVPGEKPVRYRAGTHVVRRRPAS